MAKKLIYNYTFNPGAAGVGNIVIKGNYPTKAFLVITNVTDNVIIYNFAGSGLGGDSSYDTQLDLTTLVFDYDTSTMDASDELQIFLDVQEEKIGFSETFVDPVSKLRVSNPQNLIDTDFEYGLQPTKWETIELVNNIPSFYANSSDYTIPDVINVETVQNSENITVTTLEAHNLSVGSPIDVQGLSSRTAEGKFIITAVPSSTVFVYSAKSIQSSTGSINNVYTVITPGQFYSGSEIDIETSNGLKTDANAPSTLSFETEYAHGFDPGSSLYVTNTIGKEIYNISDTTSAAPDGRPYIDFDDTIPVSLSLDTSLTETKEMTGTYAYKFSSSSVSIIDNTIEWPSHDLQAGDALLYVPPSGDTEIGGLERFQIYYVKSVPSADTITLCETTNGDYLSNSVIDLTSQGTSNYGRHQLILCYEITFASKPANNYASYFYTRKRQTGFGSGRDLYSFSYDETTGRSGYFGLGQTYPERMIICQKSTASPIMSLDIHAAPMYSTRDYINFTFGKTGTTPDGFDFIEDYRRFENYTNQNNSSRYFAFADGYFYSNFVNNLSIGYAEASFEPYNEGTTFAVFLKKDPEADSFYIQNHGLNGGSLATLSVNSGDLITYRTDTGPDGSPLVYNQLPQYSTISDGISDTILRVSSDRIRLSSSVRISSASGSYSLAGDTSNPTANSIYLGQNNLTQNQTIFVSADAGGVLPSTESGVIQPDTSTIKNVYNSLTNSLNSIKTTMGSDTWDMVMNGDERRPISPNIIPVANGTQYINVGRNAFYLRRFDASGVALSGTVGTLPTSGFANGEIYDIFQNTSLATVGYNLITTPFQLNSTIPYWVDLIQVPYEQGVDRTEVYYSSSFIYNYGASGTLDNINNNYINWISLGNGWRYTYDTNYFAPNASSEYHSYICMTITIDNSNWPGYYEPVNPNFYFSSRYMAANTYGALGQRYYANIIIPVTAGIDPSRYGASGTVLSNSQIANTIATEISNGLFYPLFSGQVNQSVRASILDGNRIKLKSSTFDNFYSFTNSGVAPLELKTEEIVGSLDGYYNISSTTSNTAQISLNSQVPFRELDFSDTDFYEFEGLKYININSHRLEEGAKVIFNRLGEGTVGNLTDGSTYYVVPNGPDYIGLAETKSDALGGNIISIGTVTAGTFNFTVESVSGISPGSGTVTIEDTSKTINGTDSLFKRFYKSGDKFIFEDTTLNPSEYKTLTIASVIDDTILTVEEFPGVSIASTNYFVKTKINVRPDGTFLHRPFDGGVEITAGSSPNSSIVRQTRKYFRYQSGKGIQCSLAINFNPSRVAVSLTSSGTTATVTTTYPHGLTISNRVTIKGASEALYNGTFDIIESDAFTFKYTLPNVPPSSVANGIIEYNIDSWANSSIKSGLFDYQNGFFFEYDGSTLYAVRRSSVQQLPGTANVESGSNIVLGNNTNFTGQLSAGDYIVMRGNSYKITNIVSSTELNIQPKYKGTSSNDIIITKTIDTKVPQSEWNIDKADGSGPSGFLLDTTKIQMCYLDYSWYGAGKIRFGFKDTYGHVKYMHEFRHNNRLEEAYMRSGNIPARYEIENRGTPTYIPSLFHWGTSVIMDGQFDDDKAYLFTASSNSLIFTNGASSSATTNGNSSLTYRYNFSRRSYDWYVSIPFPVADASKFTTGTPLYTTGTNESLNGEEVAYTQYSGSSILVYIFIQTSRSAPAVYPIVQSNTLVSIGAPASASGESVDLTKDIPLISIRLAPSVDNNLTGSIGQREIINRMQLQLKSLGMTLSHDCEVDLILNGSISNVDFTTANNPSLSQLVKHSPGDKIIGGINIFSLRASGGSVSSGGKRLSSTTDFDLSQITDLGNSVLGGDGVFPNGPDLLTIAIKPVDTSEINATTPLTVSSRITWTESQA